MPRVSAGTHPYLYPCTSTGQADRPDVEVLVDATWHPGELRGWWDRDGVRVCNLSWRARHVENYLETMPADRVRPVD